MGRGTLMGRRPVDWSPVAERDPVPGDAAAARELARQAQEMANAIRAAGTAMRRLQAEGTSLLLAEFREMTRDTAKKIEGVDPRYRSPTP